MGSGLHRRVGLPTGDNSAGFRLTSLLCRFEVLYQFAEGCLIGIMVFPVTEVRNKVLADFARRVRPSVAIENIPIPVLLREPRGR